MTNIPDFMPVLSRGNHRNPKSGACVMEMVSYVAGEDWTDMPDCVNSGLAVLAQKVNDFVSDDNRNVIALMVPRFIGTSELPSYEFDLKLTERITQSGEFSMFGNTVYSTVYSKYPDGLLSAIKNHFRTEQDMEKRLTNKEYDEKAMRILEIALDLADEMLERGEYAVSTEQAFAKIAELPSQKKVASNV